MDSDIRNVEWYRNLTFDHVPPNKLFMLYCKGNSMQLLMPENNDYDSIVLNKDKPGKILSKVVHVEYAVQ